MSKIKIIDALSNLDDDLVEKHFKAKEVLKAKKSKKNRTMWIKLGSIAACFCIMIVITAVALYQIQNRLDPNVLGIPSGTDNGIWDDDVLPPNTENSGNTDDYQFVFIGVQADWPYYKYATEIVEASTHIYHGKVTDISFAVIDQSTGAIDNSPQSSSIRRMLYTVYTIELTDNFKGDSPSETKLCIEGGLIGYKEEEQYRIMNESGLLSRYQGIPICESYGTLKLDTNYLFCVSRIGELDHIINPTQFAYLIDSDNSQKIINACK